MLEIRANRSKMNTTARADNAACAANTILSKAEVDIINLSKYYAFCNERL